MLTAPAKTAVDKAHRASVYTFTDLNQVFKHSKGCCLMKKLSTDNDPSAGSPTETLLRLLLSPSDRV